jgi:hypothetical protein
MALPTPGSPLKTEVCDCLHLTRLHDAVASRYCAATKADNLARACVCSLTPAEPARSYDRR